MTHLVSRLRKYQQIETALGEKTVSGKPWTLAGEAADEIERLTSENKLQWENIQKLLAENERLTRVDADFDELQKDARELADVIGECQRISMEQRKEIDRLRTALGWYADERNWRRDTVDIGVGEEEIPGSSEADCDYGKHAREALRGGK